MMAEYTNTNSAKRGDCHQFHPSWTLPSSASSGRLWGKLCHPRRLSFNLGSRSHCKTEQPWHGKKGDASPDPRGKKSHQILVSGISSSFGTCSRKPTHACRYPAAKACARSNVSLVERFGVSVDMTLPIPGLKVTVHDDHADAPGWNFKTFSSSSVIINPNAVADAYRSPCHSRKGPPAGQRAAPPSMRHR